MEKLTYRKVAEIVGHGRLDDHDIADIIATGASAEELLEAFNRTDPDGVGEETLRAPGSRVSELCEILLRAEEESEEPEVGSLTG